MRSSRLLLGVSLVSCVGLAFAPVACGTDNGQKQFGPTFDLDSGVGGGQSDAGGASDGGGAGNDGGGSGADGGGADAGGKDAGSCTNVLAVVSGGAGSAFGSIYTQGAWKTSSLATSVSGIPGSGTAGQSVPAITWLGSSFVAAMRTSTNAVTSVTWSAGAWSSVATIGAAVARDTPSITTLAGNAHLVIQGTDYKFYHGTYSGAVWDTATDPVGGAAALQSFGPTTPQIAGVGTEVVGVFSGDSSTDGGTGGLYDIRYSGAAWMQPTSHASPLSYFRANPAISALASGSALDLVVVYADPSTMNRVLQWTGRMTVGKTFTAPAQLAATAESDVGLSLATMANGKLALVFWGQDSKAYFSLGTVSGQSVTWTTPAALVSGTNPTVTSPPNVTAGVCGDDAVATYATSGTAYVTRLRGASWTTPEAIPMVTNALASAAASH